LDDVRVDASVAEDERQGVSRGDEESTKFCIEEASSLQLMQTPG
jgi:hypothetical protein